MPKLMTMGDLHREIGHAYSVAHLRRWAHAGMIPATIKRRGKHFRFKRCPGLYLWIQETTCRVDAEARRASARKAVRRPSKLEIAEGQLEDLGAFATWLVSDRLKHLRALPKESLVRRCAPIFLLVERLRELCDASPADLRRESVVMRDADVVGARPPVGGRGLALGVP
jgi:hypothetical protein